MGRYVAGFSRYQSTTMYVEAETLEEAKAQAETMAISGDVDHNDEAWEVDCVYPPGEVTP